MQLENQFTFKQKQNNKKKRGAEIKKKIKIKNK